MIDQKYIEAFKFGINKGPFKNQDKWIFDIDSEQLFIDAFQQAYLDASRTFRGIGNVSDKNKIFDTYAKKVQEYFQNPKEDFDTWHTRWCTEFTKSFIGYSAKYGQAQKILNMMIKYLYCCDGAQTMDVVFNNAHMPLDTYTLNWYKREVLKGKYSKKECGYVIKEWSNLDKGTYCWIQREIKEYLANIRSPLETEFIIWPDETLIDLTKNLTDFSHGYLSCKYPAHDNEFIAEKIQELEKILTLLKEQYPIKEDVNLENK